MQDNFFANSSLDEFADFGNGNYKLMSCNHSNFRRHSYFHQQTAKFLSNRQLPRHMCDQVIQPIIMHQL